MSEETLKILDAVNQIHESMGVGFGTIHTKMDRKFEQCDKRLTDVETTIEVKKALCKERKEKEKKDQESKKETRDFWKPIIRVITIAGFFALLTIAWQKIKAVLDLVS